MVVKISIKFSVCNLAGNKKEMLQLNVQYHTPFSLLPILKLGHCSCLVIYVNRWRHKGFMKQF